MSAPTSHVQESYKLTADALVSLWEIYLVGGGFGTVLCFTEGEECTWQGKKYEPHYIKISNINRNAEGQMSRPTLTIMNRLGLFNAAAHNKYFDRATVIRRRVLKSHLDANINLADPTYWFVGKIKQLIANQFIELEIRAPSDGPNQQIPARMFIPPEFPFVTL